MWPSLGLFSYQPHRDFHTLFEGKIIFFPDVFSSQFLRSHVTCLGSCKVFFLLKFKFGLLMKKMPLFLHDLFSGIAGLHYYFANGISYKTKYTSGSGWLRNYLPLEQKEKILVCAELEPNCSVHYPLFWGTGPGTRKTFIKNICAYL